MHSAFIGTRMWPIASPNMQTPATEFDFAIRLLSEFAEFSNRAGRSVNPTKMMENHYQQMRFAQMCDLINAARIVRMTAPSHRTARVSDLLKYCTPGIHGDVLFEACLSIEVDTMDQHLEYVWRHPDEFPRDDAFHDELYRRAFRGSFGDMDEEPWPLDDLREELQGTAEVFEMTKRDRDAAFNNWVLFAWRPPDGVSRADEKFIKKSLKKNEWPIQMANAFEWKATEMRRALRHVVLWAKRTGTPGLEMPQLSDGRPPQ